MDQKELSSVQKLETKMRRLFYIFLISSLFATGCVSDVTESNPSNHTVLNKSLIPIEPRDPPSIFLSGESTAKQLSQNVDYTNPIVKALVSSHITESDKKTKKIAQIFDSWDEVNTRWIYVGHPDNYTYYLNASEIIKGGFRGNCVNFATLISATIESTGSHSRIVKAVSPNGIWHVYPEILIGTSQDEIEPVIDYVTKRYSKKIAHYHQEVNPKGVTEYWLNLDNWEKTPGDILFDDNGVYHVYYPDGNFNWFRNTGYIDNFPPTPSDKELETSQKISIKIPYRSVTSYPISKSPTKRSQIKIITDNAGINVFIFDQDNLTKYQEITQRNQSMQFGMNAMYLNVINRTFDFISPNESDYFLIIDNHPIQYGADSQREVNVSITITPY